MNHILEEMIPESIWEEQDLLKYSVRQSGSKNGTICEISLSVYDKDRAVLTSSYTAGHGRSPVVMELPVDRNALKEIKDIFLKEGIYRWDKKTFSDRFIADKASTSYSFLFSDNDLSFSSQYYPKPYSDVLDKLAAVIEKYQRIAEKTPTQAQTP